MRNVDVVKEFIRGNGAYGSNLRSTGDKLFSYSTCIAQFIDGTLYINTTRYSVTTSKHRYYIYRQYHHEIKELTNIDYNTQDLRKYAEQV